MQQHIIQLIFNYMVSCKREITNALECFNAHKKSPITRVIGLDLNS